MTLRHAIIAVALALLLLCGGGAIAEPALRPPALMLAVLTALLLFENRRYRQRHDAPAQGLTPTGERFVDPETGRPMRVWAGADGERRYVEE
jgi:hypothetical protein